MKKNPGHFKQLLSVFLILLFVLSGSAEPAGNPKPKDPVAINWEDLQQEAVDLLVQYLRIDTTNPPGNEIKAAGFFAEICKREGIEHRVFEPFPGRGILWARIKGDGSRRPVILLNHTDVVPHSPAYWTVDAFGGLIKDGFIYGRGAIDMKSLGMAQFVTMLALKRSKALLKRDVIFLATADEEAGGRVGAGWFAENHAELLGNAEYLFNEGGSNQVDSNGRVLSIGVGPSEKTPAWLRLTATGLAGHASIPNPASSVNRLIRALNKLLDYSPPVRITPVVEQSFKAMAKTLPPDQAPFFENIRESLKNPDFLRKLESDPGLKAVTRNTISITILEGSNKINIIPPVASAEIDTRLVPGEKLDDWINELKNVIRDEGIKIDTILAFEANASSVETDLVAAVKRISNKRYPGAAITYPVLAGFTDSHYFRKLGVNCYGFSPFVAGQRDLGGGFHGNDEKIGKQPYMDGVRYFFEIVDSMVR